MKFDVVLGNPPYNNDEYLDFVMKGHELSNQFDLWIIPARWQCKNNSSNISFRKTYILKVKKLVYYPDCADIFGIRVNEGISIILSGKEDVKVCEISNVCSLQKLFNDTKIRPIIDSQSLFNLGNSMIDRLKFDDRFKFKYSTELSHKVFINNRFNSGGGRINQGSLLDNPSVKSGVLFSSVGNLLVLQPLKIVDEPSTSIDTCIFSSDSIDECNSFISYLESKFVRFFIFLSTPTVLCCDYSFRFVPNQSSFDCIFEDKPLDGYIADENGEYFDLAGNKHCSLYVKYKLTDEEINIIESVIRERR